MMYRIAALPGDGIGPEVMHAALELLESIAELYSFTYVVQEGLIGGAAIEQRGEPLPAESLELCQASDAVLLGAVGGPKWREPRPEEGLLALRKELGLFLNLRYAKLYPALKKVSPLRDERLKNGMDLLIVRELTGGIYYGASGRECINNEVYAYDEERYSTKEIERTARWAFELASTRRKKVTSVDKANVLESSRLWREVTEEISKDYPDVELDHLYVDNATMQLMLHPDSFDVLLCSNLFGDILSDQAAAITGSIGLIPSASLGDRGATGLFEPVHGSAPDIAGRGMANPLAMILSLALLLKLGLGEVEAGLALEHAVLDFINEGHHSFDLMGEQKPLSTKEIVHNLQAILHRTS